MSEYMFGVSRRKPSRKDAKKMERVAERHGCTFVEANLPEGYRRWFAAPNRGAPFDRQTENAVMAELA